MMKIRRERWGPEEDQNKKMKIKRRWWRLEEKCIWQRSEIERKDWKMRNRRRSEEKDEDQNKIRKWR